MTGQTIRRTDRRVRFFREPFDDLVAAMDAQVAQAPRPTPALVIVLLAGAASWWVYVPVHELLHALGCWGTGGRVTELQIARAYGGELLSRFLPFVVGGGSYAGRLSGFDTKGSDLIYLATDALPFLLSIVIGVPLLKACARAGRAALLGPALVLALAPFYSLPGDYYEMGSIITTRAIAALRGAREPAAVRRAALRRRRQAGERRDRPAGRLPGADRARRGHGRARDRRRVRRRRRAGLRDVRGGRSPGGLTLLRGRLRRGPN